MKNITILFFVMMLFACKNHREIQKNTSAITTENTMKTIGTLSNDTTLSDPFEIQEATITGNKLLLKISYAGGCQEHSFQLVGAPQISKSLPPIRSIRLIHDGNQDACKAKIIKDIEIDISELCYKNETNSSIYLQLQGWKENLLYTKP
jgi:hypothetical protein